MTTSSAPANPVSRGRTLGGAARRSWKILAPYARRHRAQLLAGCTAALAVVALRLVLPVPVRTWLDRVLAAPGETAGGGPAAVFLLIVVGLGLANLLARLRFARFAIGTVADLRAAAFAAVPRTGAAPAFGSGEAVARLIGDTARIKAGAKGFLIHVVTHGLFVAGLSVVLFRIWSPLGWVLVGGGLVLAILTAAGAASILRRASRYRGREGQLAEAIRESWDEEPRALALLAHNRSSGRHEAAITRTQEIVTWAAHGIFGAVLLALLALGGEAVGSGRLAIGDLVLIAFYAMMLRTPIIQLARQGARTGKIFACVERVGELVAVTAAPALPPEVRRVELRSVVCRGRRRRLGPLDLELRAGEHVAVVGRPGAGKTSLLELLAGFDRPASGDVLWDGAPPPGPTAANISRGLVGFLAEQPVWPRMSLRELLALPGDGPLESLAPWAGEILRACGLGKLSQRAPKGLATKLASTDLSSRERRAWALLRALRAEAGLVLLDEPARDLGRRRAGRLLHAIHAAAAGRLLVVGLHRPLVLDGFERLLELRRGRIDFDGDPSSWRAAGDGGGLRLAAEAS